MPINQKGVAHLLAVLFIFFVTALIILYKPDYFKNLLTERDSQKVEAADTTQEMKVWVLQYIPPEGIKTLYPAAQLSDPAAFTKSNLLPAMSNASKYKGYSNPNAQPTVIFNLTDSNIKVENNPPSYKAGTTEYDYAALFSKYDLCNFAKTNDIRLVILWAAGSGSYAGGFGESAVTGNKVLTNGPILSGSQYCDGKTILVLGLNYERGLAEALESYGHHLEAVFRQFRPEYKQWSDEDASRNTNLWGQGDSCGNDHNPPNARCEYDRSNPYGWLSCGQAGAPSSAMSDCRNWKPDGSGIKEALDCSFWNCDKIHDGENWLTFWMQNMPGRGNDLVGTDGVKIPNWWVYISDPDNCFNNALNCSGFPIPSPSPSPSLSPSPVGDTTPPQISITQPQDGSRVNRNRTITISASGSDNIAVSKVEFSVNGTITCSDATSPYTCSWRVPNTKNVTYALSAKAYDVANNSAQANISVIVR